MTLAGCSGTAIGLGNKVFSGWMILYCIQKSIIFHVGVRGQYGGIN